MDLDISAHANTDMHVNILIADGPNLLMQCSQRRRNFLRCVRVFLVHQGRFQADIDSCVFAKKSHFRGDSVSELASRSGRPHGNFSFI